MQAVDLKNHKHKYKFVSVKYSNVMYRKFKHVGGAMYNFICIYCHQELEVTRWDMLAMWRKTNLVAITRRIKNGQH